MDEICNELAGTGLNIQLIIMLAVAMLAAGVVLLAFKKRNFKILGIVPAIVIVLSALLLPGSLYAQAAEDCPTSQANTPATNDTDDPDDDTAVPSDAIITAGDELVIRGSCGAWVLSEFADVDFMYLFSTDGSSPLMPNTIDLNPSTPERDTSVVAASISGSVTFVVDDDGRVSMTNPITGIPSNSADYVVHFTIEDQGGAISNEGSYTVRYDCT